MLEPVTKVVFCLVGFSMQSFSFCFADILPPVNVSSVTSSELAFHTS